MPDDLRAGGAIADPSAPVEAVAAEADLLDLVCPYLLSEDGTYRSAEPDLSHRCTAQDPPGTLPLAFQERFCLTDRHVRCEMFKYAQAARAGALEQEGIADSRLKSARFRPSVRSVPLAVGPSSGGQPGGTGGSRRPLIVAATGIALVAIVVFLVILMFGGSGDPGAGPAASSSPAIVASPSAAVEVVSTPSPVETPATPVGTPDPGSSPASTVPPAASGPRLIEYEVQEGEALLKISQTFGVNRRAIIRANEGMSDQKPYTQPGDVILVPVGPELSDEEVMTAAGFIRFVE